MAHVKLLSDRRQKGREFGKERTKEERILYYLFFKQNLPRIAYVSDNVLSILYVFSFI